MKNKCRYCSKNFFNYRGLQIHKAKTHGIINPKKTLTQEGQS